MKMILYHMLLAVSIVLTACNKQSNAYDTQATVMLDQTDPLSIHPTAETLLAPLKLSGNPWQGVQIKLVGITDKDISITKTISLQKEDRLTGNIIIREAIIRRFRAELQRGLAAFDSIHSYPHSIIFRAIAKQAALLAASQAANRYLIVYSDLLENSEVNFYNPQTIALLQKNPEVIEKQLEANSLIPQLGSLDIWFLFAPVSYRQNNVYMPIARFYESIYKLHHANVHIENQFTLP